MKEPNAIRQPGDDIEIPVPVVPVLLVLLGLIMYFVVMI